MTRNIFIFLATFVVGALGALITRAAMFNAYSGHEGHPPASEYSAMVTNNLSPTTKAEPATEPVKSETHAGHATAPAKPEADEHAGHAMTPGSDTKPVNTVCAICGMPVDPSIPTATYQGKTIGFGCRMCPPKFKADPDRYGPYYLSNKTLNR